MDLSTVIGIIAGVLCLGIGMASGGRLSAFWDPPSIAITLGGSLAAMMINFPLGQFVKAWKAVRWAFFDRTFSPEKIINSLVAYAEKARREGLLALEDEVSNEDEFLKKGIQLVVDGTDPELVKNIMEIEIAFLENRHRSNQMFFETWGSVAPSFGMAGTLIGLIQMLRSMGEDLSALGPAMAVALVTTLYGVILAYLLFLPLAGKLKIRSAEEIILRQVMVEGILSIQAGENPRIVEEKLKSFLAPTQREGVGRQRRQEALGQGVGLNV